MRASKCAFEPAHGLRYRAFGTNICRSEAATIAVALCSSLGWQRQFTQYAANMATDLC